MTSTRLLSLVSAFVAVALTILLLINSTEKADAAVVDGTALPIPTPATDGSKTGKVTTSGGLTTVTFEPAPGTVRVYLPDDMRAGDTISGTVVAEPKGQTEEERAKNLTVLNGYQLVIENKSVIEPKTITSKGMTFTMLVPKPADDELELKLSVPSEIRFNRGDLKVDAGDGVAHFTSITIGTGVTITLPDENQVGFPLPTIGQQGRPLEIFGPFDGNSSNTTLRFGPPKSTVQDFEKGTENVSGGFGLIRPLAESPRKLVFESPSNVTGPVTILVKEGNGAPTTGTMRNLGVQLSAPKTNLMRGERTTLTVEVRGLEGIKEDVPLQLDSKGVITMDGGNFQNLRIKPSEVTPEGRYNTNRAITGQQAGGFSVTATVIVRPFDFCLQDDSDPNRLFYFNSFTGDYIFTGLKLQPGGGAAGGAAQSGKLQPGGGGGGAAQTGGAGSAPSTDQAPTVGGFNLTGTGKPAMKGCIITLSHNAPDRRVFARLDACTKSGDASVETTSPKTKIDITDKNTADNTAPSPPPK